MNDKDLDQQIKDSGQVSGFFGDAKAKYAEEVKPLLTEIEDLVQDQLFPVKSRPETARRWTWPRLKRSPPSP